MIYLQKCEKCVTLCIMDVNEIWKQALPIIENNVSLDENNQLGNGGSTLNSDINTNDSVVGDLDLKANIMNEIGQEFGKIKYLDMEHNLEVNSGVNSVINDAIVSYLNYGWSEVIIPNPTNSYYDYLYYNLLCNKY